jgi:hypothetical protein
VALATHREVFVGVAFVIAFTLGSIMTVEAHTSPGRRARYYDVRTLGAVATAHTPVDGTVIGYPGLSLEYDFYIGRRIRQIAFAEEVARLLARPPKDTLIMTSDRWATFAGSADPSWHVLATRTVGDRPMVVVGNSRP